MPSLSGWVMPWIAVLLVAMTGCKRDAPVGKGHLDRAEKYFAAGDYGSAEVEYKNVLRATPGNPVALRRMGTIWEARGGPYQAGGYFQKAREQAPGDVVARLGLARSWLALGNHSAARTEALEVLKIEPTSGESLVLLAKSSFSEADINDAGSRLKAREKDENASIHMARAILAMKRKDLVAAGSEIGRAASLAVDSPEVMLMKARWHLARREEQEAETSLQQAVKLAPARSPERIAYATYLLSRDRRSEGVSLLEKTTAEAPDFLTPWRMLAELAMADRDPEKAEELLEKVFARSALDLEGGILQATLLLVKADGTGTADAIRLLEKLRDVYPPNALVEFQLAGARLKEGNPKAADEALDRALRIQPDMRDALLLLGRLRLSQARFDEVARSMESFLRRHPGDIEPTLLLAEACRKGGKAVEAETALEKIANPPDSDPRWHLERGLVLQVLGKTGDARNAFEKVLALDSSHLAAAAELVELDVLGGDYDSALRRAENQRELHPKSALPHVLMASVLANQSKLKEAEENLKTAMRLEPGMLAAYELLVKIYAATGRMEEAVGQLERVRKIDPGNLPFLMTLGSIYQGTGRKAEARECYEEVLKKDPGFVAASNNLAVILSESPAEDLDRARRLALIARSSMPDDGSIADTLGWILFKLGDFKRAQEVLGDAAAKAPDNPVVRFHYAMACRAMADESAARDAFRQAVTSQPDFPGRTEAMAHLASLEATIEPGETGIRVLQEQVARDPSDAIARLRLGGLFEAENRHREAADAYEGALKVNAELQQALSRLAHLYAGPLDDARKADDCARRARVLNPGDAKAAAILGALAYRAREFERADLMFRESLAAIKDDTGLMIQGAWAAYSVGRLDAAQELMETVIARSQDSGELADGKRFLEFQGGDCPSDAINRALESDPAYVPALMARAARAEKKDGTAAVEDYEKVLEVFPRFAPARSAIKRIRAQEKPDS